MTRREWLAAVLTAGLVPRNGCGDWWTPRVEGRAEVQRGEDLTALAARDIAARVTSGSLSPVDVVEAFLRRIERLNPEINAYVTVTPDRARAQARRLAADVASPGRAGLLAGVPVAHKDLFETAGVLTTGGSRLFADHVPARSATIVDRLEAAGAVTLGKTNTHELGGGVTTINPLYGATRNPRDRARIAGGSSGGSATAVAAGLAVAATGSDTGGSIRIPAALCGVVGFKPTHGLLSTAGLLGASPTFDHAGFLARSVDDVGRLMRATVGVDAGDPSTVPPPAGLATDALVVNGPSLRGVRIGVPRRFFFEGLDETVATATEDAVACLAAAGAAVREVDAPVDEGTMGRVFDPNVVAEIRATYAEVWRSRPDAFSPAFRAVFDGPLPSAMELAAAHRARRAFQTAMTRLFDEVDLLATPTVPVVAPPLAGPVNGLLMLRNTWPFNAARMPALTVPCGPADVLPVGLQLAAPPFGDAGLLAWAAAVERCLAPFLGKG
ncbi:MAG: amidase, partial [Acidobacteriota bacterium]